MAQKKRDARKRLVHAAVASTEQPSGPMCSVIMLKLMARWQISLWRCQSWGSQLEGHALWADALGNLPEIWGGCANYPMDPLPLHIYQTTSEAQHKAKTPKLP